MLAKLIYPFSILFLLIISHFYPAIAQMRVALAVLLGITLAITIVNPYQEFTKKLATKLLAWSIVGLGFGMNLMTVAQVGIDGLGYTAITIAGCFGIGMLLGRIGHMNHKLTILISGGTAICGGSAIAALAPTIDAHHHQITVALATVFLLNAISLFIFPVIGHHFHLSQTQFGLWSALAIQDTSSVVGASLIYGKEALVIGTTVKLARALWIVPMTILISFAHANRNRASNAPVRKPWFILGFLIAAAIATWIPALRAPGLIIHHIAEEALIVTLFCIGANLSLKAIKAVGIKPFLLAIILWMLMGSTTLFAIYHHWLDI